MPSAGGQVRPTIGNPDTNTILASGAVISGTVNFPGTVNISGNLNVAGDVVISGVLNVQQLSGLFWTGEIMSGSNLISGGAAFVAEPTGYLTIQVSGTTAYLAYWVSG